MPKVKQVEIECTFVKETALAIQINDGKVTIWIPRSQISDEGKGQFLFPNG